MQAPFRRWPSEGMLIRLESSAIRRARTQLSITYLGLLRCPSYFKRHGTWHSFVLPFLSTQSRCLGLLFLYGLQKALTKISRFSTSSNLLSVSTGQSSFIPGLVSVGVERARGVSSSDRALPPNLHEGSCRRASLFLVLYQRIQHGRSRLPWMQPCFYATGATLPLGN